ncbi:MAG: hypothetical protein MUP30_13455 [Deltaproteobacteria bacterium]|nr:hypothetical protein [Deltaproteobacteria bacterium]
MNIVNIFDHALIIIGLIFVIFSKKIGKGTHALFFDILEGRVSEKAYQLSFFWVGIFFIVFGLLALFRII